MAPSPRILIMGVLAAALAAPASAAAAPHWSAPDIVFPPDPAAQAAPSIVMEPSGTAIAVSSDSRGPIFATGDAAGHFGTPQVVAAGQQPADTLSEALGADGTLAVGWETGGRVQVAVRAPGGSFAAPVELTAADGFAPALAVSPDGGVTAAWRERTGSGRARTYAIKAATVGSGDVQTFDAGTSPIDAPVAAAAPDGSVALAWRRAAPSYHVRVTIRPPGGRFAEPTLLTSGSGTLDTDVALAYGSDGTLAAGWSNQSGAFAALAAPGGAFGAPQHVSEGSSRGYGLALAGGPAGVLSAAFDGGGVLRVADGGAGGFGPASDIASTPSSEVITQMHLAYDAASGLEAAWLDPTTSAILTADRGAGGAFGAQRVGYGDIGTGTVALAAGPAGRATVLWRVRDGSVAAAVRSETADTTPSDPSSPAATAPAARDTKAPVVRLVGRSTVKLGSRRSFTLRFRTSEAAALQVSGRVLLARFSAPLTPPRPGRLRSGTQRVTFRLGARTLRETRGILKRRRHATARLEISAKDAAGNVRLQRLTIILRS